MRDVSSEVNQQEAMVEAHQFVRIYSLRAENLSRLGKPTWNFPELLQSVQDAGVTTVRVSLLETSSKRVLVVRDERGSLIGCAAFAS